MAYVPDAVHHVKLSTVTLPLSTPISDAKVFTGRQKPMTEVVFLFAEIATAQGHTGLGFSYSKRAGGPAQYAHAKEVAQGLIGEDPNDIARVYTKLLWAGASVGRSGVATQALAAIDIALYDLKAKRAGLPLAKLLGAHRDSVRTYNTSGGFLNASLEEVKDRATRSLEEGIGGIKIKVGLPVWIEEPLDAYDAEGHAQLAAALDTPIATGEMLASVAEHERLIEARACDIIQPDCPRVGGITQFLRLMALADQRGLDLAPHFAMEIHLHLAAAYPREPWVEHFDWLDPLFNERLETEEGRMLVPDRPGLGVTLSDRARAWTTDTVEFGRP